MTLSTCFVNGFICMLFFALVAFGNALLYQRNIAFDDVTSDVGWSIAARSQIHCSHVCTQNTSCKSFFYVDGIDKFCQIINVTLPHWAVNTTTTSGASYFVPVNGCPTDDTIFRTVELVDSTLFTYRVMRQTADESQALAGCINEGAVLAQVITQAKFDFIRNLLQCPGYDEVDKYRVDGNNINAANCHDPNGWKTQSGHTIPANFWNDTVQGNNSPDHCVLTDVGRNWYFIRSPCSYGTFFICEME